MTASLDVQFDTAQSVGYQQSGPLSQDAVCGLSGGSAARRGLRGCTESGTPIQRIPSTGAPDGVRLKGAVLVGDQKRERGGET